MSTTSAYLTIRGIDVDVVYKDIKNLHIGVYPPMGRVRVAAPERFDDDQVRLAVIQRLPWIKRQREQFENARRQSEREMISGESHYAWGVRYRLRVIERPGRAHFEVGAGRLLLYVPAGTPPDHRRLLLDDWYREQARRVIPNLVAKWEPVLDVSVPRWSIRRMKTKWGSCNRETGHLWFNLELAKKHPECLEYIVVHEMNHLIERSHGQRFTRLMDKAMPDWRARRDRLNEAPLADEAWETGTQ
ncbi:M48 family metallopeptidase [Amycolatopsis sp. OK19-0408]|uniref:M48 family metallopeptidase n=1 Tax=Amycolatopsis iheyensis TaxID=2945988 RepID=A0A9X2NII2_9PSEU|nr:SprT family zinc-dependent metalloprotease [Amycolatopsis iheyensis]MCR6487340.1 M48 family metallopeptidase [Amycolatopsis iheyensis]